MELLGAYSMDAYVMEFDVFRNKAAARMVMGGGFSDEFVSILRINNASLPKNGKSPVAAGTQSTLAFTLVAKW